LRFAEGDCTLHGVSVYRPSHGELNLRLNFGDCNSPSGIRHAAAALVVQPGADSGCSGLAEWMCAVMPHEVCWPPLRIATTTTTPSAGSMQLQVKANYSAVGPGLCQRSPGADVVAHGHVQQVGECALACLSSNTAALRVGDGGRTCTGFAFSQKDRRRCLIYRGPRAGQPREMLAAGAEHVDDRWTCYSMYKAQGHAIDRPPGWPGDAGAYHSEGAAVPHAGDNVVPPETLLRLGCELGQGCVEAVRQRLEPLVPKCFDPIDWLNVLPNKRHPGPCLHPPCPVFQGVLVVNSTTWEYLRHKLPVVEPARAVVDSTVIADMVSVDIGDAQCHASGPAIRSSDWWKYVLTSVVTAAATVPVTWRIMQCFVQRVAYTLVETDLGDPSTSKAVGFSDSILRWTWGSDPTPGGYLPVSAVSVSRP